MSSAGKSLDGEVYSVGDWTRLKLLLWKNWILQRNQKCQFVVALLIPSIVILILLLLRIYVKPKSKKEQRYMDVPIDMSLLMGNLQPSYNNTPQFYICYTPDTPANAAISKSAADLLSFDGALPYKSAEEMEKDLLKEDYMVGVEFGEMIDDRANDIRTFPNNFTYSLRFPSELRTLPFMLATWETSRLFVKHDDRGPRNPYNPDGGIPPGYLQEGFLPIQHALTTSWLSQAMGQNGVKFPAVLLRRFPFRAYFSDELMPVLRELLPFLIMLAFMYPCSVIASSVTSERELQLKEIMKMMGVENWLHWIAWFVKSYFMLMILVLLFWFVLKINIYRDCAILTYSEWIPILLFLHTYIVASICFCFMLAVFFSKASTASVATCIMWYMTFIPHSFLTYYYDGLNLMGKLTIALFFSNSAMALGVSIIMDMEGTGMGTTMKSIFQSVNQDDDITIYYVIMTLTMSSAMYLGVCLYVEQVFPGNYGIARKWNFLFSRQFWCGEKPTEADRKSVDLGQKSNRAGVQLINLQKTYGKFQAVKGLNLKMYSDEITVLLGHNGAGKTTTLHMLTGIITPTAGTALINGYDIRTQMDKARQSLGICPQTNVLFMKMSVRDHIVFFSKLKGIRGREAVNKEIIRYVGILGLGDKSKVNAENLSGGMKRKLSLCCAMCGNARVVLCDEPSSGIDAAGRKSLWELLQSEKQGRTVLLTTHYMDEADVLGDRIAILSDGRLQCSGTSFHLKKRYGRGYQLVCTMLHDCDVDTVTELINRHIPDLQPEREMGTELTYRLPHQESNKFADLLADLDRNRDNLKLSGYGLSVPTLEDVFMEVNNPKRRTGGEEKNKVSPNFQTLVFATETRENRAFIRCLMCFEAMLLKKVLITLRNYFLTLIQILLPVVLVALTTLNAMGSSVYYAQTPMQISLLQYKSSYVVVEDKATSDPLGMAYVNQMERYGKSQLLKTGDRSIEDYILSLDESWDYLVDYAFLAGMSMSEGITTVWLNNKPLHTAPLTLNMWHNAMARHYLGDDAATYVTNKPLPYNNDTSKRPSRGEKLGEEVATNFTLIMCFVTAFFVIPVIRERELGAQLLQFLSGVNAIVYWITMFLWDYLIFIISCLTGILTLACFRQPGFSSFIELGRYFVILLIFGLAALPLSYVMAGCFKDPATGFVRVAILNIITGCALYILSIPLIIILQMDYIVWIFRVFPHFCLANAMRNVYINNRNREELCPLQHGIRVPESDECPCCDLPGYFGWITPGVLPEIVYILVVGTCLYLYLFISDGHIFQSIGKVSKSKKKRASGGDDKATENAEVVKERMLVKNLINTQRKDIPLMVDNIRKQYKKKLAVKDVSFHVGKSECFGLLGINGAGKTSVFKMLTGDSEITSGDAYVDGISVSTQMRKARHKIGYCPQFDAIFDDLTGRQNLKIYCLLKGIQQSYVALMTLTLARAFGFETHLDKQSKKYSGGNKRKLSTAIAILGNPSVVFLDEPTSGMDPGARRKLWMIMGIIRTAGKALVLTSHSMDECEALCTRLTIMVDGEFKCIGSSQSLKNQFSKGLILKVKVERQNRSSKSATFPQRQDQDSDSDDVDTKVSDEIFADRINNIHLYLMKYVPEAKLNDNYNGLLTYYMPQTQSLSDVFRLIESNQKKLFIEDYMITQTRLEEIFLEFALNCDHREPDVTRKKCCCCYC